MGVVRVGVAEDWGVAMGWGVVWEEVGMVEG